MKSTEELDRLEFEFLRGAREQMAPDRTQRTALRSAVLASVGLGLVLDPSVASEALASEALASEAPAPRPSGVQPKAGPTVAPEIARSGAERSGAELLGPVLEVAEGAMTATKALALGVFGGAILGFAAGYLTFGSVGGSDGALAPSAALLARAPEEAKDRAALSARGLPEPAVIDASDLPRADGVDLAALSDPGPSPARRVIEGGAEKAGLGKANRADDAAVEVTPMSFYEELTYLRRAQAALRRGEAPLALGLMQSLDGLDSTGALLSERAMTKILSLCLLERSEEAVEIARGLVVSGNVSMYGERLASSCARSALDAAVTSNDVSGSVAGSDVAGSNVSPAEEGSEKQTSE